MTPHRTCSLVSYLAEFGWTLADVIPAELAMLVAARNAAALIDRLEIPVASRPPNESGPALAEHDAQRIEEMTAYCDRWRNSRLPDDEMDVGQAGGIEDLPRIFPTQWLLEELQPAMFYSRWAAAELLMPVWQKPTRSPRDSSDSVRQRDLLQTSGPTDTSKQHAYVLLDTSRTMNDHDRRGTVARGLALAFLLHGYRQRSRLGLRPFTADVGDFSHGTSKDDLQAIARRVLRLPNSGQTRIQTALEKAAADVREAGPCLRADILLISDGISRLSQKPLGEERLHTFILGDLLEGETQAGTVATLKEWSTTFQRIWSNRFADLLVPTAADLETAADAMDRFVESCRADSSDGRASDLNRVLENVRSLLREFRRGLGKTPPPPALADLEERLCAAERLLGSLATPPQAAARHVAGAAGVRLSMSGSSGRSGEVLPGIARLLTWLRCRAAETWRWIRRRFYRVIPRRRFPSAKV
ncbi:MAG: VWA domain-containing protein [Rhodopirellula sp.]|nr:VWA domain-containing protein [Rhodopirellula sp.]